MKSPEKRLEGMMHLEPIDWTVAGVICKRQRMSSPRVAFGGNVGRVEEKETAWT